MSNTLFSLLNNQKDIICGNVRMFVTLFIVHWTIHLINLALNYTEDLLVFIWVFIVLLLLQICLVCYERDVMLTLSDYNKADVTKAFNSTLRYLHHSC